jgi:P-type Ca2+ transporter type 2C
MTRHRLPHGRLDGLLGAQRGLAGEEAAARRDRFGANDIVESRAHPWWELLRETARDPMLWFLVGTAALYAALGERVESTIMAAALLPIIGMDAFLHRRVHASVEGLRGRLAAWATVVRDGANVTVPAAAIVPGDLVLVSAPDPFPADGLIVAGDGLQVDESVLTGEAFPVRKRPMDAVAIGGTEPLIDGDHWGFAGTRLLTGSARLRVALTGGETIYGAIVRTAVAGTGERTPLQAAIGTLVTGLTVVATVLCLILAFVRLSQGHGWIDALVSAVTLGVAALPEELPVVLTIFLGVGVHRLARSKALVRRAVSVENIGRISCICTDKTGTITEGRLRLTHVVTSPDSDRAGAIRVAAIASRPDAGDPVDAAIAAEASPSPPHVAIFPFTEARKRESAVVREDDGTLLCATKGAVEVVLGMLDATDAERASWGTQATALAEDGHKVIACASRPVDEAWPGGEPERGFRFVGLLAFEDPVRDGVTEAVAACRRGGIRILMVTGDHPATARAVAREVGLGDSPVVVLADEIETRPGPVLPGVDVVARAVPAQKLALVRALRAAGEVVAVTGDGVNDVPALQAADVGIAMGERGTRSAREVASIVLLDDNFRTIVRAVAEGRQLLRNLERSFQYLLMIHAPLVVTAALVPLGGYPLLYLPVHVVWLELVLHPTAMLAFQDAARDGALAPRARGQDGRFFARHDWWLIGAVGALATIVVVAGYLHGLGATNDVPHGRALALATLTSISAGVTAALSRFRTGAACVVAAGTAAVTLALVQTPALASLLHLTPLHATDWLAVGAATLTAVLPFAFVPRR